MRGSFSNSHHQHPHSSAEAIQRQSFLRGALAQAAPSESNHHEMTTDHSVQHNDTPTLGSDFDHTQVDIQQQPDFDYYDNTCDIDHDYDHNAPDYYDPFSAYLSDIQDVGTARNISRGTVYTSPCSISYRVGDMEQITLFKKTNDILLTAVLDCGASTICLSHNSARTIGMIPHSKIHLKTAARPTPLQCTLAVPANKDCPPILQTLGVSYPILSAMILNIGDDELLLGQTFFHDIGAVLSFKSHTISFPSHTVDLTDFAPLHCFSSSAQVLIAAATFDIINETFLAENDSIDTSSNHTMTPQQPAQFFNSPLPKAWYDEDELDELEKHLGVTPDYFGQNPEDIHFTDEEYEEKAHAAAVGCGDGSERHYQLARLLLAKHRKCFQKRLDPSNPMKVPPITINTIHDQPVGVPKYIRHDDKSEQLKIDYVKKLVKQQLIQPSNSFYNAMMMPVGPTKPDGTRKIAHDFRALNKVTVPVTIAISSTEEILERAAAAPFSSVYDFLSAYLQLPIHPDHTHKLAFLTPLGKFEYRRAPMGPCNLPGDFSNRIEAILSPVSEFVSRFYDDCVSAMASHYFVEGILQLDRLPFAINLDFLGPGIFAHEREIDPFVLQLMADDLFLQQCAKFNAVISIDKTKVARRQQTIVGHEVGFNSIRIADKSMQAIQRIKEPSSVKQLLQFLGLANFCSKYINNFAELTLPLTTLLSKDAHWSWGPAQQHAFHRTKEAIFNCSTLCPPIVASKPNHTPFLIYTDASNYAIGVIFCQFQTKDLDESKINILRFYSKKLSASEQNYTPTEKEGLAVVFALSKTHNYICDAPLIILYTDHQALTSLLTMKSPKPRVMRWILLCQQYAGVVLKHKAGVQMTHVDAISRLQINNDSDITMPALPRTSLSGASDSGHTSTPTSAACWAALSSVSLSALPLHDYPHRPHQTFAYTDQSVLDWDDETSLAAEQANLLLSQSRQQHQGSARMATTRSKSALSTSKQPKTTAEHSTLSGIETKPNDSLPVSTLHDIQDNTPSVQPSLPPQIEIDTLTQESSRPTLSQPVVDTERSEKPYFIASKAWHEEIWLNTAAHESLRTNEMVPVPRRFWKRLRSDMDNYKISFDELHRPKSIQGLRSDVRGNTKWFNIPPPSQRVNIIVLAHIFGHFGLFKTRGRVEDMGHSWTGLDDDITQLIKRCTVCQQDNVHASISHPAISIPIPDSIFDVIHMDLLEMVPSDDQDPYIYIFLLVDRLSKFPVAFPIRNKEATTIAACLWNAICLFGVPTTIVSDRGREFVNETVEALCTVHGVDRRITSAYRPQANGQVERANQSLLSILRKCTAAAPARWTDWLDYALLALRTAIHASTGFSPFHLMFGRPFRNFLDFSLLASWDTSDCSPATAEVFASFSHQLRQASISSALDNAAQAQERQRHSQDAHRAIELQRLPPKSVVYLREIRPDSKLAHRFIGPFFVHHTSSENLSANYLIADDKGKILQQSYPRDQLFQVVQPEVSASLRQRRLYSPDEWKSAIDACSQVHAGPLSFAAGDESLWVIDKLLDRQVKSDGNIVLVKWSGYADPQWIPESDIPSDTLSTLLREWRHEQALQSGFGVPSRLGRRRR